ncbi:serine hydrolase domain-containing protein [Dyella choica]|uniref:serine hydrolase domain-containing protein n=1 Tax=Dyella choica TaxID=1927959 RepID=UPI001E5C5EB6|nr:serine hydrolase domain-containing protein [Dyella choica]
MTISLLGATLPVAASEISQLAPVADQILSHSTQQDGPGISALVSKDGKVIYRASRGMASLELHVATADDDVYRVGSITKTVTAATILLLSQQGKLSLADPLSRFLPDFPHASDVTIAELLNHTAGISDAWNVDPTLSMDTRTLVGQIAKQPLDFKPGSEWRYSNSGYMLLGAVIEKVTGRRWDEVEHDLVFAPFGMAHTGYYPDDAVVSHLVQGYSADTHGAVARPPFVSINGPMTAGALASTSDDVRRLVEGLNDGKTFPSSLLKEMTTPVRLPDGSTAPYGYGVMPDRLRGEQAFEHNGGIEGFSSQYVYMPEEKVTVVVLTNSDAGKPNARSIAHQLAALAIGKPYQRFDDASLSRREVEALLGSYEIQGESRHVITSQSGQLYIQRAPGPKRPLTPARGELLYYSGDGTDYFHVVRSKNGEVTALEFYPDGMGPSRLEKRVGAP